ncbi:unnamed protein product [Protopolystoma xenopodis]|uniref:Uncharacterized protein n=1 Tax=Protopolystoma xenopodis TaxID=117903 RepID=A0A3S5CBR4_9PLAT|nr:unnamed protein product [Protopolystoma xenopodis]
MYLYYSFSDNFQKKARLLEDIYSKENRLDRWLDRPSTTLSGRFHANSALHHSNPSSEKLGGFSTTNSSTTESVKMAKHSLSTQDTISEGDQVSERAVDAIISKGNTETSEEDSTATSLSSKNTSYVSLSGPSSSSLLKSSFASIVLADAYSESEASSTPTPDLAASTNRHLIRDKSVDSCSDLYIEHRRSRHYNSWYHPVNLKNRQENGNKRKNKVKAKFEKVENETSDFTDSIEAALDPLYGSTGSCMASSVDACYSAYPHNLFQPILFKNSNYLTSYCKQGKHEEQHQSYNQHRQQQQHRHRNNNTGPQNRSKCRGYSRSTVGEKITGDILNVRGISRSKEQIPYKGIYSHQDPSIISKLKTAHWRNDHREAFHRPCTVLEPEVSDYSSLLSSPNLTNVHTKYLDSKATYLSKIKHRISPSSPRSHSRVPWESALSENTLKQGEADKCILNAQKQNRMEEGKYSEASESDIYETRKELKEETLEPFWQTDPFAANLDLDLDSTVIQVHPVSLRVIVVDMKTKLL